MAQLDRFAEIAQQAHTARDEMAPDEPLPIGTRYFQESNRQAAPALQESYEQQLARFRRDLAALKAYDAAAGKRPDCVFCASLALPQQQRDVLHAWAVAGSRIVILCDQDAGAKAEIAGMQVAPKPIGGGLSPNALTFVARDPAAPLQAARPLIFSTLCLPGRVGCNPVLDRFLCVLAGTL